MSDPGTTAQPRFRKPASGPTDNDIADRDRWTQLAESSLTETRAPAEKWRTGLAAFVTLVTGGLILKGPDAAAKLSTGSRLALSILFGIGMLAAIAGLWAALAAAAGTPSRLSLPQVQQQYGGVRQFEIACAAATATALRYARILVAVSLLSFSTGVITWWWAPQKETPAPARVVIDTRTASFCGELTGADGRALRIKVSSKPEPVTVPLSDITELRTTSAC